jgi:hypothetical protein
MLGSLEVSALGMGCQNFAGMYGPPTDRQRSGPNYSCGL